MTRVEVGHFNGSPLYLTTTPAILRAREALREARNLPTKRARKEALEKAREAYLKALDEA